MKIRFLGTNGWYANKMGNTVCTAILAKDRMIVLDAGDGFYKAADLAAKAGLGKVDVFISHLHLDHCAGLHMLAKFGKGTHVRIFIEESQEEKLRLLVSRPFTADLAEQSIIHAPVEIVPFKAGKKTEYFFSLPLAHPEPTFGFRMELEGKTIAYCLDSGPCAGLIELAKEADVLITECSFLPGTKINPKWPHMNPELAAMQAKEAGAKKLVLTHFGAEEYKMHADREVAGVEAKKIFQNTVIAYDDGALEI